MSKIDGPRLALAPGAIADVCDFYGISKAELCRRMKIDPATLYKVETGRNEPGNRFIAALRQATGRPLDALFVVAEDAEAVA